MEKAEIKNRPYWHVDMKWVTALLFLFFLGLTLFAYQLFKITSPKTAIPTATLLVATMFSGGNLDKTDDLEEAKKKFPPDAEGKIHPLPSSPSVVILAPDLNTLSPREIRLKIFSQVVEPIYYRGSGKEYALALNDQEAMKQLGALAFLTEKNHNKLKVILIILSSVSVVLLALLIKFSAGFGRMVSVGLMFILTAIPGLFLTIVLSSQGNKKPPSLGGENGYGEMIGVIMAAVGPTISKQFAYVYIPLFVLGIFLLFGALFGKIFGRRKKSSL